MLTGNVRVIGKNIVDAKLVAAAPHILAENHLVVETMLDIVQVGTAAQIPLGPGHFGYHTRDRLETEVKVDGLKTLGYLFSPVAGYWREFGTQGRFRRSALKTKGKGASRRLLESFGGHGERAFMTAHKVTTQARKLIGTAFYNGKAKWWRM